MFTKSAVAPRPENHQRLILGQRCWALWGTPPGHGVLRLPALCLASTRMEIPQKQQQSEDPVEVKDFSEAALRSTAGNGISIPCAGFVLETMLCMILQWKLQGRFRKRFWLELNLSSACGKQAFPCLLRKVGQQSSLYHF